MKKLALLLSLLIGAVAHGQIPINQLPPAVVPLTGAEQIPMVQGTCPACNAVQAPVSAIAATVPTGVTQVVAGTNISVSPAGGTGVVTVNSTSVATPAAGSDTQVQYNASGAFGANASLSYTYSAATPNLFLNGTAQSLFGYSSSLSTYGSNNDPMGLALSANIGFKSNVPFGSGNQSFNAIGMQNRNAAGYTALEFFNDSYDSGANIATLPTYTNCCNVPNGGHMAAMIFQGTTVGAGAVLSSMPAGEGLWEGTINNTPFCLGTFQHCIGLMDGNFATLNWSPGAGSHTTPDVYIHGTNGGATLLPALRVDATTTSGISGGVLIHGGTNSSDYAFQVSTQGTVNNMQITGDGTGWIGAGGTGKQLFWDANGAFTFSGANASGDPTVTIEQGHPTGNNILLDVTSLGTSNTVATDLVRFRTATSGAGVTNGLYLSGGTNSSDFAIQIQNAAETATYHQINGDGSGSMGPSATNGATWTAGGNFQFQNATGLGAPEVAIAAPTNQQGLKVTAGANATSGPALVQINTGNTTAGNMNGLLVQGGTTSADYSVDIQNGNGSVTYATLFGDGHGFLGNTASRNASWDTNGHWTWAAPAATGQSGFTFNGFNGNNAMLITTTTGSGTAYGLDVQAGTTSADYALFLQSQGGSTNLFEVFGNGTIQGRGATGLFPVDMTPDKGTFTATYTGFTTGVTCTATWAKMGLLVQMHLCGASGTSNVTTFTITGIPSEIQPPALTQYVLCGNMQNNSAAIGTGGILITAASGTWTPSVGPGQSVAWTGSGTKGISNSGCDFSYQLQ